MLFGDKLPGPAHQLSLGNWVKDANVKQRKEREDSAMLRPAAPAPWSSTGWWVGAKRW